MTYYGYEPVLSNTAYHSLQLSQDHHLQAQTTSLSFPPPLEQDPLPTPPHSRLAGEPAFCAGRHCCQWQSDGRACDCHFHSAEALHKHVAQVHAGKDWNGQPTGDYHCHWAGCNKTESFGNKPKLTRHIHSHTGHKPYSCSFAGCHKAFVTKEQLKNHETTHTRTREHICPVCGKGFAVKTALTSHMNVHKGTKPYVCEVCGKGFADSSNLSKHKAIHKRRPSTTGATATSTTRSRKPHHLRRTSTAETSTSGTTTTSPSLQTPILSSLEQQYPLPPFLTPPVLCPSGDPCFKTFCPSPDRIPCLRPSRLTRTVSPCHSAPCSNRACSIEPCALQDCPVAEPCDVRHCEEEECGLPGCDLAGCEWMDCGAEDCIVGVGEIDGGRGLGGEDEAMGIEGVGLDGMSGLRHADYLDYDFSEADLKRLQEFIHDDACGCGDLTSWPS